MIIEICRSLLAYLHVIGFALALAAIVRIDVLVVRGGGDGDSIERMARALLALFLLLWVTGLLLIQLDTGLSPAAIGANSKLSLKLLCVTVLSVNGVFLHRIGLRILLGEGFLDPGRGAFLCITGALSTSHWLLAAYIGGASVLASFPFATLLASYAVFCLLAVIVGLAIAPRVRAHLNRHRAERRLAALRSARVDNGFSAADKGGNALERPTRGRRPAHEKSLTRPRSVTARHAPATV